MSSVVILFDVILFIVLSIAFLDGRKAWVQATLFFSMVGVAIPLFFLVQ